MANGLGYTDIFRSNMAASLVNLLTVAVKVFSESMGILCVSTCGYVYLTHYQRRNMATGLVYLFTVTEVLL